MECDGLLAVFCYNHNLFRGSIQLLASLLRHRCVEVQQKLMGQPMGLSRLVDLLQENREVRLLLLLQESFESLLGFEE